MTNKTDIQTFFSTFPRKTLKKGEILLYPNEPVPSLYYLVSGYIRMYSVLPNGNELTITIFKPGVYIPLFLVIDDSKNVYYYEAFTDSVVQQAPVSQVMQLLKDNTDILFDVTKRISSGLRGLVENLQYQLFGSVRLRIIATVLMLSKRFGEDSIEGSKIMLPLTHQDIADLVGVARETVSLEMKKLQEERLITYSYKQITVVAARALQEEIGSEGTN